MHSPDSTPTLETKKRERERCFQIRLIRLVFLRTSEHRPVLEFQGEVIDAPYKGISHEECLDETVHVASIVCVLQSNTLVAVRHLR